MRLHPGTHRRELLKHRAVAMLLIGSLLLCFAAAIAWMRSTRGDDLVVLATAKVAGNVGVEEWTGLFSSGGSLGIGIVRNDWTDPQAIANIRAEPQLDRRPKWVYLPGEHVQRLTNGGSVGVSWGGFTGVNRSVVASPLGVRM